VAGLVELRQAIVALRTKEGSKWLSKFTNFYMSTKRTCDLRESCALQSLTPEVARAGRETRMAYEAEMLRVVDAIAEGLPEGPLPMRRKMAWAVLSLLSGGVTLARATEDGKVGDQIVNAVTAAVLNLAHGFTE
jgi:hypothetical protein